MSCSSRTASCGTSSSSATFLYAIGFIGGFGVPTRLDGPADGPLGARPRDRRGAADLFAVQHSVMARKWFKQRVDAGRAGGGRAVDLRALLEPRADRCCSGSGGRIGGVGLVGRRARRPRSVFAGCSRSAGGWCSSRRSSSTTSTCSGCGRSGSTCVGQPYTRGAFATPVPYRLVRHPLYVGWLFAFWATPTMTAAHLLFAVGDDRLHPDRDPVRGARPRARARETYEEYRRRVPMLVPFTATGEAQSRGAAPAPVSNRHRPV